MRIFKWVVPAAVVTALALGLIGAAPASAAETVLCEVEVSPCKKKWELTSFEAKAEPFKLLASGFGTVECASSTIKGGLGMLNAPQGMALESLVFANCKMGMIGCTVKATGLGGMAFLRTQVNLGVATLSNTSILVECSLLQCEYEGEPAFHLLGKNGAETAKFDVSELTLTTIGGASCPKTTKLDASYTILVPLPVFIQS